MKDYPYIYPDNYSAYMRIKNIPIKWPLAILNEHPDSIVLGTDTTWVMLPEPFTQITISVYVLILPRDTPTYFLLALIDLKEFY